MKLFNKKRVKSTLQELNFSTSLIDLENCRNNMNNKNLSDNQSVYYNNNNNNDEAVNQEASKQRPAEEEYSINIMKQYPLGFNKTKKECEEEQNNDPEAQKSEGCTKTPRKKKAVKKDDENEEAAEENDESPSCIYNVWVPDCLRSKKDFIECQQINLNEIETKSMFEKVFSDSGYFNSIPDYYDFLECGKGTSTRILQGVETKFGIEIDVSDSFYGLTGIKLRAYSFQGANRKVVYSAFCYFQSSWTQEMAINSVTNYNILFQPDDWYYSVIQSDVIKEIETDKNESVNALNKNSSFNQYSTPIMKSSNADEEPEENFNQNRLHTNSEVESIGNVNNENSAAFGKNDHVLKLCIKYLRIPKIKFRKRLFTSIKSETDSISYTVSNMVKLVNENNNKNIESMSLPTAEVLNDDPNYRIVNFIMDSYNKPIPIWIKLHAKSNKFNDFKSIKTSILNEI